MTAIAVKSKGEATTMVKTCPPGAVLLLSLGVVLLSAGCGDDSTGPEGGGSGSYYPLSVGAGWSYGVSGYWVQSGDTTDFIGTIELDVIGMTPHAGGFELYELRSITEIFGYDQGDTLVEYVHSTGDAVRFYDDTVTTDYFDLLELPLTVGGTWLAAPGDSTEIMQVLSLSEPVTVPGGSYEECAWVQKTDSDEPGEYNDYFYAQGVGLVRQVSHDEVPGLISHAEYELN